MNEFPAKNRCDIVVSSLIETGMVPDKRLSFRKRYLKSKDVTTAAFVVPTWEEQTANSREAHPIDGS